MAYYTDQFYLMDPGNPPAAGTALTPTQLEIRDRNNDNIIDTTHRDTVNGSRVTSVWDGDQITVLNANGAEQVITGVTFYTADGSRYFTPTDGSKLHNATFVSSTFVTTSTQVPIGELGPPCFVEGTMILTPDGERAVETLMPGDMVITLDNGPQPVRWRGSRTVTGAGLFAPIRFEPGAVGNVRPLLVSPQHRMLLDGWRAELFFGHEEVLVGAKHLVNGETVRVQPMPSVTYVHLLFDRHEILEAEGAPSESFHPGEYIMAGDEALCAEIITLFPELSRDRSQPGWETARVVLKAHEARMLARVA